MHEPQPARSAPGGEAPLRAAPWTFLRPMLSPGRLGCTATRFVIDDRERSTIDLEAHRGDASLDDLDLGVDEETAPTRAAL